MRCARVPIHPLPGRRSLRETLRSRSERAPRDYLLPSPTPPPPHPRPRSTLNNSRVYVIRGELVAAPFPTSAKRKVERGADAFGKVNTILNPPGAARTSTYHSTHNLTSVHVQTAGSVHKRSVPFAVNAPRNRVLNLEKKRPPPFSSTLDLKNGGIANSTVYPYRTTSKVAQEATALPMEARTGWTNTDITAGMARREHQRLFR